MNIQDIVRQAEAIRKKILNDNSLKKDLDHDLTNIPKPFLGNGEIKVIIIGQDPTVQRKASRLEITTVLNLDKNDSLRKYIDDIMIHLGYNTDKNIYATNVYKCFFEDPPAKNKELLNAHLPYWIDLLRKEMSFFPDALIITLGEPVLQILISNGSKKVNHYWDYVGKTTSHKHFDHILASNNILGREFFPLPHQPSYNRKKFYKKYFDDYIGYVKSRMK